MEGNFGSGKIWQIHCKQVGEMRLTQGIWQVHTMYTQNGVWLCEIEIYT